MFKYISNIGLALALVLPPYPLPLTTSKVNTVISASKNQIPPLDGKTILFGNTPTIFTNNVNGLTVHTSIIRSDKHLIQDVQMIGSKESVRFKFVLDDPVDEYNFSQRVQDDKTILTKELIIRRERSETVPEWRFIADPNITLKLLNNGSINILRNKKEVLATIQPFVYWTKQGQQKNAQVSIEGSSLLLNIQERKESYPLTIDPSIAYGQWLGNGSGTTSTVAAVAVESATGEIYVGGGTDGALSGVLIIGGTFNGGTAGFVAEVASANPPIVNWMHYLGGSAGATLTALAVNGDEIYAGGYTASSDSWNTAGSTIGTFTDAAVNEGFVVEIADGAPPSLVWNMWIGGVGSDLINALAINGDEIYAGGYTASSDSWDTAGSTVGTFTNAPLNEGFVVEITDGAPPSLTWRMWIGGVGSDIIYALAINGDEVYVGGSTSVADSWDTAGSTIGTFTDVAGLYHDGFVVEIADGGPPSLAWRMWIGGSVQDIVSALAINGDEIYAGGYTNSSGLWDTAASTVGTMSAASSEGFVVEIGDGGPSSLDWRMWLGGTGTDRVQALAVNGDEIYAGGYARSTDSWETVASAVGTMATILANEGFIVEIADGGPPTLAWRMWLGSDATDQVYSVAVNGDAIYAGAFTTNSTSIETFSTVSGNLNITGNNTGYLTELNDGGPPTYFWLQWLTGSGASQINALAVNGNEIYAGGTSYPGYIGTVTDVGTPNYVQEGFVVEIADGATPSLNWRVWLGGPGTNDLKALAVNGDEIYAGGYTNSSDSWDTAASTAGTLTNTSIEGFVVEIADASPPTLAWRMWLGGVGNDYVLALAVNGDEIYAGGYTSSSASWDTAGSLVGTFTNPGVNESFVVEIADGGPPTLAWLAFIGSVGVDQVNALAVNGDEVYAGGYTASSASWDTFASMAGTFSVTGIAAYEGFVVEIADGGPPTFSWLFWLGGSYLDVVSALAINGNEIYAGGSAYSSDSWETAASTVGTFTDATNAEGFVVEIADSGPPSLAWRMWLGGTGADEVLALAVNGDEIYAAGDSYSSDSWETAISLKGTFTDAVNTEGFVVEIADGGPPSLNWVMWEGGVGGDIIYALAVNGDEIYAGGYIPSTAANEGTFSGTKYDGQNSGFVVEIADDTTAAEVNAIFFGMGF